MICAKCGSANSGTQYHKQGCENELCGCATCSYGSHAKEHREHLHYFCRTCGFDWLTATKDPQMLEVAS